ncbi:hypothetical protein Y1Q_0014385 [Alligator mississippiensis]|uniref:Uncharacterized protein n=1 Tax=Alligator mississippiensis TaxID=8496 RepID=A0A151PCX1_ALLMI|nr:hypothetical protein Y1Q_0014385 [Alligator mississippiensis]
MSPTTKARRTELISSPFKQVDDGNTTTITSCYSTRFPVKETRRNQKKQKNAEMHHFPQMQPDQVEANKDVLPI